MSQEPTERSHGTQRSHNDAQAANTLFQAAGQAIILINGGAATALLTYTAADKTKIIIDPTSIQRALMLFALGVVLGAVMILCQAASVQRYVVYWEGKALRYAPDVIEKNRKAAWHWGAATRVCFFLSASAFLTGVTSLALSLK